MDTIQTQISLRELSCEETAQIGGAGLSAGIAVFALATGFVAAGPVGMGIATCGLIAAAGVDGAIDLVNNNREST